MDGRLTFGDREDEGAWRVLYLPSTELAPVRPALTGQAVSAQYPERALAFHAELSFPDACPFDASDEEAIAYSIFVNEVSKRYAGDEIGWGYQAYGSHRLLGHWLGVQFGDPPQESRAASATLDWWDADSPAPGVSDEWCLLLQLDTDSEAGLDLPGSGRAYFCIPRQDLAARRFDRVWLVLKAT